MQQVKLFKSVESELESLEAEINRWVVEQEVRVISVTGNISPQTSHGPGDSTFPVSDVLVILMYEKEI
jgi:hypothetical protein